MNYEVRFCEKCKVLYRVQYDALKRRILTGDVLCFCEYLRLNQKNKNKT